MKTHGDALNVLLVDLDAGGFVVFIVCNVCVVDLTPC